MYLGADHLQVRHPREAVDGEKKVKGVTRPVSLLLISLRLSLKLSGSACGV
jgi:hypothetical protein